MKKIEKFFKNINISINEKHKEETKNKILEFYEPAKRGFNFYRPLRFAALAAACLIIVSITVIQFYDKSGSRKEMTSLQHDEVEKVKTENKEPYFKAEEKRDESKKPEAGYDKKVIAEKNDLSEKKAAADDLDTLKNEKSAVMGPIKEKTENQLMMKNSETRIEQTKFINSIKVENTYQKTYSAVKSVDVKKDGVLEAEKSKRSESREKEAAKEELKDASTKSETTAGNNFISTAMYNKVSFQPNISVDSFHYLNNQLSQNLAVDLKNINDEEVINYFTKEDKAENEDEVFVEGTLKSGNYYYFLINLEPEDYLIKDLSIIFNSNVSNFYIYGYNEDIGKVYDAQKNMIKDNHASVFLIVRILYLTEDIAKINITQSKNGSAAIIERRIKADSIKDIKSTSIKLRKAILGYMILSGLKSSEFTKSEIIEYRKRSIAGLPPDVESLYKSYINYSKN